MEKNDCYSLFAVVKECAQMAKRTPVVDAVVTVTPIVKTTGIFQTPYFDQIYLNNGNSQTPFLDQIYPKDNNENSSQTPFLDEMYPKSNNDASQTPILGKIYPNIYPKIESGKIVLSSRAGVVNNAAPAENGSTSKDGPKVVYNSPSLVSNNNHGPFFGASSSNNETPIKTSEMSSDLVELEPSLQHLELSNLKKRGPLAVDVDHLSFDKRRKFEERRVVKLTYEELSRNDQWAWRKYGQKPIKGSPYPRNYYKCSSLKGCKAKKHVEQSSVDPNFFIVTYVGEHYHPIPPLRSVNGTRIKFAEPNPQLVEESPKLTAPAPIMNGYGFGSRSVSGFGSGSGSGFGFGYGANNNVVNNDPVEEEDSSAKTNSESFGSGEKDESDNDDEYGILIPNLKVDTDYLTGMNQLRGPGGKIFGYDNTNYYYNNNVRFAEIMPEKKRSDPNEKTKENGFGYGVGIRYKYGSTSATFPGTHDPASNMGKNDWGNVMIKPQSFYYK